MPLLSAYSKSIAVCMGCSNPPIRVSLPGLDAWPSKTSPIAMPSITMSSIPSWSLSLARRSSEANMSVKAGSPHDIGYVRGVCRDDRNGIYITGVDDQTVTVPSGASDAALTPHHVDRGKRFVRERFGGHG